VMIVAAVAIATVSSVIRAISTITEW
jgi:hypothetical protein